MTRTAPDDPSHSSPSLNNLNNPHRQDTRSRDAWSRWLSLGAWICSAATCLAFCVYVIRKARFAGEDSWFPMVRALEHLHGSSPSQVYESLFFTQHIKFQYPPSGLLLLDLVRWLGINTSDEYNAINAWLLIGTALAFSIFAVQMFGPTHWFRLKLPVGPIAFLTAVGFYPNQLALQFGQIQILLGLLFVLACLALLNDKRALTGCLIAAGATIKPQFFLLGLLALWQRDWRFLAGFITTAGAALVLSIGLYGWHTHLEYLKVLGFLSQHGEYHHLNQSVNGILNRFLYHGPSVDIDPHNPIPNSGFPPYIPAVYFGATLASLIMIAIPFAVRTKTMDSRSKLLLFITASVLFTIASPIAWVHHYNVLLPAYAIALKIALDRWKADQKWILLTLIGISFILSAFPLAAPFAPTVPSQNLFQSHVFFGACILIGVMLIEMLAPSKAHPRPVT